MDEMQKERTILMADDDAEDCELAREALQATGRPLAVFFVRDGEELFDFLRHEGEYQDAKAFPRPDIILVDFKMPRKDGRETIRELKLDPRFRRIPVMALTTSNSEDDISFSYDVGVNAFIAKPVTYRDWVAVTDVLCRFWFDSAELPPPPRLRTDG